MSIFEVLRADHDVQRGLIDQLLETEGASASRDRLFEHIRIELAAHAAAEERCFYAPLMHHDLTIEKARHSVAEHQELDEFLQTLKTTETSSPAWLSTAKKLQHRLLHHLKEEEREVFQLAGKVLSDEQKESLRKNYLTEMSTRKQEAARQ